MRTDGKSISREWQEARHDTTRQDKTNKIEYRIPSVFTLRSSPYVELKTQEDLVQLSVDSQCSIF